MIDGDGIGGTDSPAATNVEPLFKDRPTAAGLPPQPEIVEALERMLADAKSGNIAAMAVVLYNAEGGYSPHMYGKAPYVAVIGGLADLQFRLMIVQNGPKNI